MGSIVISMISEKTLQLDEKDLAMIIASVETVLHTLDKEEDAAVFSETEELLKRLYAFVFGKKLDLETVEEALGKAMQEVEEAKAKAKEDGQKER